LDREPGTTATIGSVAGDDRTLKNIANLTHGDCSCYDSQSLGVVVRAGGVKR
jgi:hypothetical protein